ncbi:hypothetical protein BV501_12785 [Erwinia sp. OAMSP11]|nr:hypothetical protein BV501_12785 [Erwinia sp. OAMSP11]
MLQIYGTKKPALERLACLFWSRGSFTYPFLSLHRLVGVLPGLLTSCFCWCCPCTVLSKVVELAGVEPAVHNKCGVSGFTIISP